MKYLTDQTPEIVSLLKQLLELHQKVAAEREQIAKVLGSNRHGLLAIPFIAIGSVFTAPNFNLVNGMPSYVSMVLGFLLVQFHRPSGVAVLAGTAAAFYGAAFKVQIRVGWV